MRALALLAAACLAAEPSEPAPGKTRLRVLAFNILYGGDARSELGPGHPLQGRPRHAEIAAVIRESQADIVVLCETTPGSRNRLPALLPEYDAIGDLLVLRSLGARPLETERLPPKHMTGGPAAHLRLANGTDLAVLGTHWRPHPDAIEQARLASLAGPVTADRIRELALSPSGIASAEATVAAVRPLLEKGFAVIVAGDLNQASHLDWTERGRAVRRWAGGETPAIPWEGTRRLAAAGLVDAYRAARPDEAKSPGDTWTPAYPEGTPGRRPWADQYSARIDYIFTGGPCRPLRAWVVGEPGSAAEITREPWVSDHRAVLAEVEVGR